MRRSEATEATPQPPTPFPKFEGWNPELQGFWPLGPDFGDSAEGWIANNRGHMANNPDIRGQ